jgi:hypothetical protein
LHIYNNIESPSLVIYASWVASREKYLVTRCWFKADFKAEVAGGSTCALAVPRYEIKISCFHVKKLLEVKSRRLIVGKSPTLAALGTSNGTGT